MEALDLKTQLREQTGGSYPKRLRGKGFIPGVVYGLQLNPFSVQVERGLLEHALHTGAGENILINLIFDDQTKNTPVIIKEVQHDIVTEQITHVDFKAISLSEKVQVRVHLHVKGEAKGVAEGGILDLAHREIEVECLPTHIPNRIDVDVTGLEIGDGIHARDLVLPDGVELLEDPETVVVVVLAPQVEEVAAPAVEGLETAAAEPEVIAKGKKDEVAEEAEK